MPEEVQQEEFSVTFRNGALARLKKVAHELNITDENLAEVLKKGVVLMDVAKEGNNITFEKAGQKYVIDLRRL